MNKLAKIRLRNGQEYYLDKEARDRYNTWYKFCNKNFTKPRDEQFYKEFVEYYKKKSSQT